MTATQIPAQNSACWIKLAQKTNMLKTNHLGTQLMLKRLEKSSDAPGAKAAEIYAFFAKWQNILRQEIAQIATL